MWPTVPCSCPDGATGFENSDSSSKTIRVEPPLDQFHHDLTHENLGQMVTRNVYRRTPSLAVWAPLSTGRRVLRTMVSRSSIFRPGSILMGQMWLRCHGSCPDGATGLENSDSSSKTIRVTPPLDKFHHDLTHENLGQRVTRPVYRRIPTLAIWRPMPTGRRVLRTIT